MPITTAPTVNEPRINDRIRAREVRLVDPDGLQLGIKPLPDALALARDLDLDLVEVAPLANPPVCRIMDYGKFKFDAAQRARESRRKTSNVGIKEMKYRPKIGAGDFDTKTRRVLKFLAEGHKVKITIMFRGRELYHPELGKKILDRIAEQVDGSAKVEAEARLDGRNMVMVLAPDKRARQSAAARGEHHGEEHENGHADADPGEQYVQPVTAEVSGNGSAPARASEPTAAAAAGPEADSVVAVEAAGEAEVAAEAAAGEGEVAAEAAAGVREVAAVAEPRLAQAVDEQT
jgi:translation initiation factor IF-3